MSRRSNFSAPRNVAADQTGRARHRLGSNRCWPGIRPSSSPSTATSPAQCPQRSALGAGRGAVRDGRVHLSPKLPFGWVDFPPSVNRLIGLWWLAQDPLSRRNSTRICATLTRDFYCAILSRHTVGRRYRPCAGRAGLIVCRHGALRAPGLAGLALPSCLQGCCSPSPVGRYPIGLGDLIAVRHGKAVRPPPSGRPPPSRP